MKYEEAIYLYIGKQLKEKRRALGLTQGEVADKTGSTRTSITNIETGYQKPPIHVLYKLCYFLGVEIQDVIPSVGYVSSTIQGTEAVQKNYDGKELNLPPLAAGVFDELINI